MMTTASLCSLVVVAVVLAGCGEDATSSTNEPDVTGRPAVEAAFVRVVANTIVGVRDTKELILTRGETDYRLEFRCEGGCACTRISARASEDRVARLASLAARLPDEGEAGTCCDRPWTQILLVFSDGTGRELISGEEVVLEEIFELSC